MLRLKNRLKNIKFVHQAAPAVAVLVVLSLALVVYGQDNNEIDVGKISQNNPFVRFAGEQTPSPTPPTTAQETKPELFVETITLKFLDARSLKTSISNMSGPYGSMEPDGKSNSLIICDTNENLVKMLEQIRKVERKPEQIMIEVVLLDVKLNDETEIGVNWDMLTTKYNIKLDNSKQIGTSFRQNLGFSPRAGSTDATTTNIGNATAFNTTATGTGSDFSLIMGDIRNVVHALQEKNNVEILGSPRVMVVNGKKAIIKSVEERPYTESTTTGESGIPMTYTKFKEIGVTLDVTATLTDERFILDRKSTRLNSSH